MFRHVLRRLIQSIPTLFGITLLAFFIMSHAPGSALGIPDDPTKTKPEQIEARREQYGLNDPWYLQYLVWLTGNDWMWWKNLDKNDDGKPDVGLVRYGILRGDFSVSFTSKQPAMQMVLQRLPATAELGIAALLVSVLLGVPIGILAAIWRGGIFDNFTRIFAVVGN